MNDTEQMQSDQAKPSRADESLRADALNVVAAHLALHHPSIAFEVLEYLHGAAAHVPEYAGPYLAAADELRECMGFDRLYGERAQGPRGDSPAM